MNNEMRDLTQQEIDDAPEWATHYLHCDRLDMIRWNDNTHYQWESRAKESYIKMKRDGQPIPRKEVDIKPYKHWCDPCYDSLGVGDFCYYDEIDRGKAVEIAKHFKLTLSDSELTKKVEALEADNSALKADNALLTRQLNNAIAAMEKKR